MQTIDVALLGFGTVGQAFIDFLLRENPGVQVKAIADSSAGLRIPDSDHLRRTLAEKRNGRRLAELASESRIADPRDFIRRLPEWGISVLVESLPTNLADGQPALDLLTEALSNGVHLVSVDKGPFVHGYEQLTRAAQSAGVWIGFSGTTGVVIPEEVKASRVLEIRGVLNGTSNYVLTQMQEYGLPFDQSLARAQAEGIAEPDPRLDLEGWDTISKILILAKSLMRAETRLSEVSRIGISGQTEALIEAARASNRKVRLVGRARIWQGRVRVSVAPKLVDDHSPFYSVSGTSKLAVFRIASGAEVSAFARSGRDAISRVILDDVLRVGAGYSKSENTSSKES